MTAAIPSSRLWRSRISFCASAGSFQRLESSAREFRYSSRLRAGSQSKMPPQQGYRLPDLVDNVLRFRAHGSSFCPVLVVLFGIGAIHRHGTGACKAKWARR
ncbi:hypothetical protein CK224_22580 [Mesorhizobium sp. WSM3862]|nr:hypothetical protein CK224_22580 [Mesorhizobium sp. WSM3862]